MNKRRLFFALAVCLAVLVWKPVPIVGADMAGFSVAPILPPNQSPDTKGYFDLIVEPGQQQALEISIVNKGMADMAVKVETIAASTNENGIVNYTSEGILDESMLYRFTDLATPRERELVIPANDSVRTRIDLKAPAEPFPGLLLGSIQVTKELTEEELGSGHMILNQYSYVVGVRLRQNDEPVEPAFTLGEVSAMLSNHRASVVAQIRNTAPLLVKGMRAAVQVESKSDGAVLFERHMQGVDMAPNSILPFTLTDQAGYGLRAGTYVAKAELEYMGQVWQLEKDFIIYSEEAASINQGSVNQITQMAWRPSALPLWAVIVIAAGGVLTLAIVTLLVLVLKKLSSSKKSDV